jgi:nicotinamidase-related amidase
VEAVDVTDTALLVMDVQRGVMEHFQNDPELLDRTIAAVEAARAAGLLVVFVRVGFRPGFPEVHPRNRTFRAIAEGKGGFPDAASFELEPSLGRRDDEPLVIKHRVSAFASTDLEMILKAKGIGHLVLAGVATRGVVLSTLCAGVDLDYRLTVLSDGCGDYDDAVHRVLIEEVFARRADIASVEEFTGALQATR